MSESKRQPDVLYMDSGIMARPYFKNPMYLIYSNGKIYTKYANKFLSPRISSGYSTVSLYINGIGKSIRIHRLVAKHFVINPDIENKIIVDHIDNNKFNNDYTNLQWLTHAENSAKAAEFNKLKNVGNHREVLQFDNEMTFIKEYSSMTEAYRQTGISARMIKFSCDGIYNTYDKNRTVYHWKYKYDREKIPLPEGAVKIPGYDVYYAVRDGRIYSTFISNYLIPKLSEDGYQNVTLKYGNIKKTVQVHIIIAEIFLGAKPSPKMQVNHKDKNRANSHIDNLEYMTPKENNKHKFEKGDDHIKRAVVKVDPNTLQIIKEYDSIMNASRDTGIHFSNIGNTTRKLNNSAGGYLWFYKGDPIEKPEKKDLRKKIEKLDLTGNVICVYNSIEDARKSINGVATTFRRCISNQKEYYGYLWRLV